MIVIRAPVPLSPAVSEVTIPTISPTLYPLPPLTTVAEVITFEIEVKSRVNPLPCPVIANVSTSFPGFVAW